MLGRRFLLAVAALALPAVAVAHMYAVATSDPVVRRTTVPMPDWPASAAAVRLILLTDVHVAGPDMPPSRLARIVEQVNRLKPDLVVFGGDFVSDKLLATKPYPAAEGLAPLAGLRSRYGSYAVLGNHDHWRDAAEVTSALREADVRVLDNEAVTVGPLRVGGVNDEYTKHADLPRTVKAMRAGPGSRVLLSHGPDVTAKMPSDISLILSGHTHCGQIRLPFVGALTYESNYGARYGCGFVREGPRRLFVSAGLGTSVLPLRLGAKPDMWLVTLEPQSS